jgi:hypothetical protein
MGRFDYASIDPSTATVARRRRKAARMMKGKANSRPLLVMPTNMSLEGLELFAHKIQVRGAALWSEEPSACD